MVGRAFGSGARCRRFKREPNLRGRGRRCQKYRTSGRIWSRSPGVTWRIRPQNGSLPPWEGAKSSPKPLSKIPWNTPLIAEPPPDRVIRLCIMSSAAQRRQFVGKVDSGAGMRPLWRARDIAKNTVLDAQEALPKSRPRLGRTNRDGVENRRLSKIPWITPVPIAKIESRS